jgi:V/A-type H+-transporting ATPase subunit I
MVRLLAVALEHDADRVAEVLLDHGVMHFMDVSKLGEGWSHKLKPLETQAFIPAITDLRKRIESLIRASGQNPHTPDQAENLHQALLAREELDLDHIESFVDGLTGSLNRLRQQQRTVAGEITSLTEVKEQVSTYGMGLLPGGGDETSSFIAMRVGELPVLKEKELRQAMSLTPSVVISISENDQKTHLLIISLKRNDQKTVPILERLGWRDVEFATDMSDFRGNILADIEERITRLKLEEEKLRREIVDILGKDLDRLYHLWHELFMYEKYYSVQSYFRKTSRTVMFSGWLPEERRIQLMEALRNETRGRCYIEWSRPDGISAGDNGSSRPPVQLRNPRLFAPFQMLVTGYTIPAYGTIDPTYVVVFAYLVMFGLMFADVGQGMVLLVTGLICSSLFRKGERKEHVINLMKLIAWCGISAVLFGALFGSYFGFPLLRPLWFDYHSVVLGNTPGQSFITDLFDILAIAVYFGIAIISLGLIFNWINLVRLRRWPQFILDKGGLVGGWIYGGGIYTALYLVRNGYRQLPDSRTLLLLLGIPALLLFLKQPIGAALKGTRGRGKGLGRRDKTQFNIFTPLNMTMVGVVELLEVFSGYISNTLSFLRVAGLGIAHVSLMTAFIELAAMAGSGDAGTLSVWSVAILVAGNVLVIGLEGLSAGIQSLRLHYYEFFTKFLQGSGDVYAPVSLRRMREDN